MIKVNVPVVTTCRYILNKDILLLLNASFYNYGLELGLQNRVILNINVVFYSVVFTAETYLATILLFVKVIL